MGSNLAFLSDRRTGSNYGMTNFAASIGRAAGNQIVLDDPRISKQHAVLLYMNGKFYVQDMGSLNGTVVNGQCIVPLRPVQLNFGDELCIGLTILLFIESQGNENVYEPGTNRMAAVPGLSTRIDTVVAAGSGSGAARSGVAVR